MTHHPEKNSTQSLAAMRRGPTDEVFLAGRTRCALCIYVRDGAIPVETRAISEPGAGTGRRKGGDPWERVPTYHLHNPWPRCEVDFFSFVFLLPAVV